MANKIEIKIQGLLDEDWKAWFKGLSFWFNGLSFKCEGNFTIISGELKDEAYLLGILNQIRDLNLKLISFHLNAIKNEIYEKENSMEQIGIK